MNHDELMQKIKERAENDKKNLEIIRQQIISSDKYILWLEEFTNKNPNFDTRDSSFYICFRNSASNDDLKNIRNLAILYSIIFEYAKQNYIYPKIDEMGEYYYNIKYNNVGYRIGEDSIDGTFFFCERVPIDCDFIDFNDVMNNKVQENVHFIQQNLIDLANYINYLVEAGVPEEAIKNVTLNTLGYIENKSQRTY